MRTQAHPPSRLPLLRHLSLALLFSVHSVSSQETPTLNVEPYDYSTSYRQSVCARQQAFRNGTVELRRALEGMDLHTVLLSDDRYFRTGADGSIDETYPGLIPVLLDEIASRGRFAWRNSFGVIESSALPEGKSYTDLQAWSVETYDLSAAQWAKSISRMKLGISYPEGWYDARSILVGLQGEDESKKLDLWSLFEPFTWQVWVLIVCTVIGSALVYMFLDWFDDVSDEANLGRDPAQNLFLSALSFTGNFEFQPKSNPARIFTFSLAFWSLIIVSAYTANLASFLVVQHTPSLPITSVEDAVRMNYPICVFGGTVPDESLTNAFSGAQIVRTESELEGYSNVRDGTCTVMLTVYQSWEEYKRDRTVNGDCRLEWIGRVFRPNQGGFATISDSGTLCTSLVRDVINLHLSEMKVEGFIEAAWEDFFQRQGTIDCNVDYDAGNDDDDTDQLTLQAMGGTFIIHFALTALAISISVLAKCYSNSNHQKRRQKNEIKESFVNEESVGHGSTKRVSDQFSDDEDRFKENVHQQQRHSQYEDMVARHDKKLADMIAAITAMQKESKAMQAQPQIDSETTDATIIERSA